jgi:hypothetical protein
MPGKRIKDTTQLCRNAAHTTGNIILSSSEEIAKRLIMPAAAVSNQDNLFSVFGIK